MNILEILSKALEAGLVTQEQFDSAKGEVESKKFTQEDLNKHITDRVKREEEKYKPQLDELTALKEKLGDKTLDDLMTDLTDKDSKLAELETFKTEVEEKEKETTLNSKIDSLLDGVKLPKAYRSLIELSEDEEALKTSVESVVNQFKEDLKESGLAPSIGGGTSPAGGTTGLDYSNPDALLYAGIKELRSQ